MLSQLKLGRSDLISQVQRAFQRGHSLHSKQTVNMLAPQMLKFFKKWFARRSQSGWLGQRNDRIPSDGMVIYGIQHDKISALLFRSFMMSLSWRLRSTDAMGVSTLVALPEQVGLSHLCRLEAIGVFAVPRAHVACGVPSHRWADVGRRWEKYGQEHHLHVRLQFASRAVEAVLEV